VHSLVTTAQFYHTWAIVYTHSWSPTHTNFTDCSWLLHLDFMTAVWSLMQDGRAWSQSFVLSLPQLVTLWRHRRHTPLSAVNTLWTISLRNLAVTELNYYQGLYHSWQQHTSTPQHNLTKKYPEPSGMAHFLWTTWSLCPQQDFLSDCTVHKICCSNQISNSYW